MTMTKIASSARKPPSKIQPQRMFFMLSPCTNGPEDRVNEEPSGTRRASGLPASWSRSRCAQIAMPFRAGLARSHGESETAAQERWDSSHNDLLRSKRLDLPRSTPRADQTQS